MVAVDEDCIMVLVLAGACSAGPMLVEEALLLDLTCMESVCTFVSRLRRSSFDGRRLSSDIDVTSFLISLLIGAPPFFEPYLAMSFCIKIPSSRDF